MISTEEFGQDFDDYDYSQSAFRQLAAAWQFGANDGCGSIATIRHFQKLSFSTGVNLPESMADNQSEQLADFGWKYANVAICRSQLRCKCVAKMMNPKNYLSLDLGLVRESAIAQKAYQ